MKNIFKKFLLITVLLFAVFICKAKGVDGTVNTKSISITYIEQFSTQSCLKSEPVATWHTEATKRVGNGKAYDSVKPFVNSRQWTSNGYKALSAYAEGKRYEISGVNILGKKLFSHKYHVVEKHVVEKDSNGNYVLESNDGNNEEYHFLGMRHDSPAEMYHVHEIKTR